MVHDTSEQSMGKSLRLNESLLWTYFNSVKRTSKKLFEGKNQKKIQALHGTFRVIADIRAQR